MVYSSIRDGHHMYNSSLVIERLDWSHMGRYICTVNNGFGVDTISTFLYPLSNTNQ